MVKINKIYTRSGDGGETHLVGGVRIAKDAERVQAYGDIDELNSVLGWCRTLAESTPREKMEAVLADLQNELFDLGSELATAPGTEWDGMLHIGQEHVERLEALIDDFMRGIPELRSFVLPGGTQLNSSLHIARTVCRRAERSLLSLTRAEPLPQALLAYVNRLSDLLFAMARHESHCANAEEYLWRPGGGDGPQEKSSQKKIPQKKSQQKKDL